VAGCWITRDFALHRELDLAQGDVVAFTENVVTYVHPNDDAGFLAQLDAIHAKWATTFLGGR
jgi:hypothetical protein